MGEGHPWARSWVEPRGLGWDLKPEGSGHRVRVQGLKFGVLDFLFMA